MQGTHQVAQKFTTTTLPLNAEVSSAPPSSVVNAPIAGPWPPARRPLAPKNARYSLASAGRAGKRRHHPLVRVQNGVERLATV